MRKVLAAAQRIVLSELDTARVLKLLEHSPKRHVEAVAELRGKTTLSADEREFLEYFELLEEIRFAPGGS